MNEKSIAEVIHDRVFAEGGTLHVWRTGARFRRVDPPGLFNPRKLSSPTDVEDMDCLKEFQPSEELRRLIVAHADDIRAYFAEVSAAWNLRCRALPTPRGIGSSRPAASDAPIGRDGRICECHGEESSGISPAGASGGVSGGEIPAVEWSALLPGRVSRRQLLRSKEKRTGAGESAAE